MISAPITQKQARLLLIERYDRTQQMCIALNNLISAAFPKVRQEAIDTFTVSLAGLLNLETGQMIDSIDNPSAPPIEPYSPEATENMSAELIRLTEEVNALESGMESLTQMQQEAPESARGMFEAQMIFVTRALEQARDRRTALQAEIEKQENERQ